MIARTWAYGTRKSVKVVVVERGGGNRVVGCEHADDPSEVTLCLMTREAFEAVKPSIAKDQQRTIEFRQGGPMGGYWHVLDGLEVAQ